MADIVLKIDADTARYIAKIAAAANETKKIGETAGKGIGSTMESSVSRALLRIELLKKALRTVADAANDIGQRATDASKTAGDRRYSLATSLSGLGVKDVGGAIKQIEAGRGLATSQQTTAFVEALASASEGQRAPLDADTAQAAIAAFQRGGELLYGKGGVELTKGFERGLSVDEITRQAIAKRPGLGSVGADVLNELATRSAEDRFGLSAQENRNARGLNQRVGQAYSDYRGSQSLGGEIAETVEGKLGLTTPTNEINARKNAEYIGQAIERQTRILNNPTLNLTGQGEAGR